MHTQSDKTIKVIITGGGTGGHIMPLLAVAEELRSKKAALLFVGSGLEMEKKAAKKLKIDYKSVLSGKYRRYFAWQNFVDPFRIAIGFFQSLGIILVFKPKVIFAKGGYVTFPAVLAGWVLRVPIITHESDVIMGLANRWEARLAQKICVGYPIENFPELPLNKLVFTGNPVSKQFSNITVKQLSNKPIILVTGGSQGARFINQIIAAIMPKLSQKYQVIHIAGENDYEWLKKNSWPGYKPYGFTEKFPELMKKADLIISRAGANTLSEISVLKKPSILIPLPTSASDHQLANAKIYEKNGASVVVSEKGLTPDNFLDIIENLITDKQLMQEMGKNAGDLSQPDAASAIAEEIINK